jgi:hypothetical protein
MQVWFPASPTNGEWQELGIQSYVSNKIGVCSEADQIVVCLVVRPHIVESAGMSHYL